MKWMLILLPATMLAACGDSSSEANAPPPPTPSAPGINLASEFDVAMMGTLTITPVLSHSEGAVINDVEWKQTGGETLEIITADSNGLKVNAPHVSNTESTSWQLTVTDSNGKTATSSFDIMVRDESFRPTPISLTVDSEQLDVRVLNLDSSQQSEIALIRSHDAGFSITVYGLRDNALEMIGSYEQMTTNNGWDWFSADILSKGYEQFMVAKKPATATETAYFTLIDDITSTPTELTTDLSYQGTYYAEDVSGDGTNEIYRMELAHNDVIEYRCETPQRSGSTLTCDFYPLSSWQPTETNGYFMPLSWQGNLDDDPALEHINETFEAEYNEELSETFYTVTGISITKQTSPFLWQQIGEIPDESRSGDMKYAVTDVNSDGFNEIIRMTPGNSEVFFNTGALSANFSDSLPVEDNLCLGSVSRLATVEVVENIDINGDGTDDLLCENGRWTQVVSTADRISFITEPLPLSDSESISFYYSQLTDFDGDGDRDILFSRKDNEQRSIAINTEHGFVASAEIKAMDVSAWYRDFDGDGDLDAFVEEVNQNTGETTLKIYTNLLVNSG